MKTKQKCCISIRVEIIWGNLNDFEGPMFNLVDLGYRFKYQYFNLTDLPSLRHPCDTNLYQ